MAVSARQILTSAFIETGIRASGETPPAADMQDALKILNREIMDKWNAIRPFGVTHVVTSGTFTANSATRTIGPTGNYVVTSRPVELLSAAWVDDDIRIPIRIRDEAWYADEPLPEFTSTIITDIAYFPTSPNGTMYPWPIPTANVTVEIETRSVFSRFTSLDNAVDLAPGYESAITETLKELLCPAWGVALPEGQALRAREARAVVMSLNMRPPQIATDEINRCGGSDTFDTKLRRTIY